VASGAYDLVVYARSTVTGRFDAILRRTITLTPPPPPLLTVDTPAAGASAAQSFTVSGWAIDPSAAFGTGIDAVHAYLTRSGSSTPVLGQVTTYGTSRPDVGNLYGSQFTRSGYTTTIQGVTSGIYQLTLFARTVATGRFDLVVSRMITVIN
jgi:hypothetical protein